MAGKELLINIGKKLNIKNWEDWYSITALQIRRNGGSSLLSAHGSSPANLITTLLPQYPWKKYKFKQVPVGYWKVNSNLREFFEDIRNHRGFVSLDDFYSLRKQDIVEYGGQGLLAHYGYSVSMALSKAFPDFTFFPWKFKHVGNQFWSNFYNQRAFLEYVSKEMKIKTMEDWYSIATEDIIKHGGSGLLHRYNNSLSSLLETNFPSYHWKKWKFVHCPIFYWNEIKNQRLFFEEVGKEIGINKYEDWYRVSQSEIEERGGKSILWYNNNSLYRSLKLSFPEYHWLRWKFKYWRISYFDEWQMMFEAIEWLREELRIESPCKLMEIPTSTLAAYGIYRFAEYHGGFFKLLEKVYPLEDWENISRDFSNSAKIQNLLASHVLYLFNYKKEPHVS